MRERYDAIYLSPHFDDAVLSCGGQIFLRTRAAQTVLVVTVMGAPPPAEPASPFARELHAAWDAAGHPAAERRREEAAACARLGADHTACDFTDAVYRAAPAERALYPSRASITGPLHPADEALSASLADRFRALPPADFVAGPLGAGRHVDHRLVRRAAEEAFGGRLVCYEDFPYAKRWLAMVGLARPRRRWRAEVVALPPEAIAARCEAIEAYASQRGMLFRDRADIDRRVGAYVRRRGGERLWHLAAGR